MGRATNASVERLIPHVNSKTLVPRSLCFSYRICTCPFTTFTTLTECTRSLRKMASTIPDSALQPKSDGETLEKKENASPYTIEGLKAHGTRESFWMLLHDKVYDVTAFMDEVSAPTIYGDEGELHGEIELFELDTTFKWRLDVCRIAAVQPGSQEIGADRQHPGGDEVMLEEAGRFRSPVFHRCALYRMDD